MVKAKLIVASLLVCLAFSSCVSMFGTKKKVYISSTPSNASVYRDDGVYVGTTPVVYKGKAHHNFIISKSGYYEYGLKTTSKFNPLYLGNIILIPYGFLEFNNANTFKDTNYSVTLTPKPQPKPQPITPTPVRIPTLLESVSSDTENYTRSDALSVINPTYSSSTNKVVLEGKDIYKRYTNAVFMLYGVTSNGKQVWQGSGFFVNADGLAVSNYHNFENAKEIVVKFYGSESYQEISSNDILAYSKNEDYIIFKVQGKYSSYIPIANKRSEIGEKVYTIGSPKGLENTFSSGEISQYRIEEGFIQISAPIDHGSSGGVLINEYGEAIGITSAGRDDSGANLNFCKDLLYIMNRYR